MLAQMDEEQDGMNNRQVVHSGSKRWKNQISNILLKYQEFRKANYSIFFFFKCIFYFISLGLALFAANLVGHQRVFWKSMKNRFEKQISVNSIIGLKLIETSLWHFSSTDLFKLLIVLFYETIKCQITQCAARARLTCPDHWSWETATTVRH